jgi:hypothetical protein
VVEGRQPETAVVCAKAQEVGGGHMGTVVDPWLQLLVFRIDLGSPVCLTLTGYKGKGME